MSHSAASRHAGTPFEQSVIDGILEHIAVSVPGFSIVNCKGYWRGAERTYIDHNFQIIIDVVTSDFDAITFFAEMKRDLAERLRQDKIYITREQVKEEFISFEEFFSEIGVEAPPSNAEAARELVRKLAAEFTYVRQCVGYETTALRRDVARGVVIWERRIHGIRLRSELVDDFPKDARLIAADQVDRLARVILSGEPVAVVGGYEYQFHILHKVAPRPLLKRADIDLEIPENFCFLSKSGERLSVREFITYFTTAVFVNCIVLRDEGYLPEELRINVGSDGSLQQGKREGANVLLHSPATIPYQHVQEKILDCLRELLERHEAETLDPIALMQAKALEGYILKRAMIRNVLQETE